MTLLHSSRLRDIITMARRYGWREEILTPLFLAFHKNGMRINLYPSTMTTGIRVTNQTQGKSQIVKRKTTLEELEKLFCNPYAHSEWK